MKGHHFLGETCRSLFIHIDTKHEHLDCWIGITDVSDLVQREFYKLQDIQIKYIKKAKAVHNSLLLKTS